MTEDVVDPWGDDLLGVYVFCLMVNPNYLQRMAEHRFGKLEDGWEYLEKFVDIRLSLGATDEVIGEAARQIVLDSFVVNEPFGFGPEFTVERAAVAAKDMASLSMLSLREIKRLLLKVEVALRCYQDVPVDAALLVWLAFCDTAAWNKRTSSEQFNVLPRARLASGKTFDDKTLLGFKEFLHTREVSEFGYIANGMLVSKLPSQPAKLSGLPIERYQKEDEDGQRKRHPKWFAVTTGSADEEDCASLVREGIQPWYIRQHREMLEQVHQIQARVE